MSEATEFTIGSEVACSDGVCGELTRVVVDPVARAVTHIVVEPANRQEIGRLVPVELVESADEEIRLRCATSEFEALEDADETRFLPGADGKWGYGQGQMLSMPYYGLGMGGIGMGVDMGAGPQPVTYDRVPVGEVEVRRGEHVHATDGPIPQVQGRHSDQRRQGRQGRCPAHLHEGPSARPPADRPRRTQMTLSTTTKPREHRRGT